MNTRNFFMVFGKRVAAFAAAALSFSRVRVEAISFSLLTGCLLWLRPQWRSAKTDTVLQLVPGKAWYWF